MRGFNSMKVRLKQEQNLVSKLFAMFQFHEGPIKTYAGDGNTAPLPLFQFHEGPIKTTNIV